MTFTKPYMKDNTGSHKVKMGYIFFQKLAELSEW